jgi:hypothetical protein
VPRALVTDKLGSYAAAQAELLANVAPIQDKRSNNRAENGSVAKFEIPRRLGILPGDIPTAKRR